MKYHSVRQSVATTDPPDKPDPNPGPDVPPPDRPSRDVPKPGDPPGTPQPGDPPPAKPEPDKPGPVRPKSRLGIDPRRTGFAARAFSGDMHECRSYRAGNNCGPSRMVCSLLVILLLVCGTAFAQPPAKSIDDDDILQAVETELRSDEAVSADHLDVTVENGTVRLDGMVDTWHERKAAGRHAYQSGARRVNNELDVRMQRNTPTGLKATLVPKQSTYEIDPDRRGKDFRRLLKQTNPVRDPRRLPPPPEVDLALELDNQSDQPLDVRFGHDKCEIDMSLTGTGAVHVRLARAFTSDFHSGRLVTIKAGENLKLPIHSLQFGFRNAAERWYWTQPGEYMLQVTYNWPADVTGVDMQAVAAPPVRLKVTFPEKE